MKLKKPEEIKYIPIRYYKKNIYYFDGEKIVVEPEKEAYENIPDINISLIQEKSPSGGRFYKKIIISGLKNLPSYMCEQLKFAEKDFQFSYLFFRAAYYFIEESPELSNKKVAFRMFSSKLQAGDTYDVMEKKLEEAENHYEIIYKKEQANGNYKYTYDLKRFITKIEKPCFIRFPENTNKNTFDLIKISANMVSEWPDKRKYINQNLQKIIIIVLETLENNKSFLKYNIPIGCLSLSDIWEKRDSSLEFTFELKKELLDIQKEINNGN